MCKNYEKRWDQMCAKSHGESTRRNGNLLCSLIQKIIFDCKDFYIKKNITPEISVYYTTKQITPKE